jgi:hypothetical protein
MERIYTGTANPFIVRNINIFDGIITGHAGESDCRCKRKT